MLDPRLLGEVGDLSSLASLNQDALAIADRELVETNVVLNIAGCRIERANKLR